MNAINRLAPLAVLTSVLFVGILTAKPVLAQVTTASSIVDLIASKTK